MEDKVTDSLEVSDNLIVWLGPSRRQRPEAWFGPKPNTKFGFNHHPPPQTFRTVPGHIGS